MADDWQEGDKAFCIKQGNWRLAAGRRSHDDDPMAGRTYTVSEVIPDCGWGVGLSLVGFGWHIYVARRFIKLRDHIPDAEDTKTIALLTGKPVKENVT